MNKIVITEPAKDVEFSLENLHIDIDVEAKEMHVGPLTLPVSQSMLNALQVEISTAVESVPGYKSHEISFQAKGGEVG